MKAIILVAGYAIRLYPLTESTTKAFFKLGSITVLDIEKYYCFNNLK